MGHPLVTHPRAAGVGLVPLTIDGPAAVSVNDAYLEPARDRPNLTVLGGALVDRLLLGRRPCARGAPGRRARARGG